MVTQIFFQLIIFWSNHGRNNEFILRIEEKLFFSKLNYLSEKDFKKLKIVSYQSYLSLC